MEEKTSSDLRLQAQCLYTDPDSAARGSERVAVKRVEGEAQSVCMVAQQTVMHCGSCEVGHFPQLHVLTQYPACL